MGVHHVRCAAEARGVALAGAWDVDASRRTSLPPGVPFAESLPDLLARCDAVVLAVPTEQHADVGSRIVGAGRHLLVEKPLAATAGDCDALARAAAAAGVVLRVGHVERFNAAWLQVHPRLERPRFAEGHRLAGFDPRGTDVDVILDLMIHDLDLVLHALGEEPTRVEAVGVPVLTDRVDIANVRLEFGGGALVSLTASRVSREPVRKLRIFQADAYFSLDFRAGQAEMLSRAPSGVARETIRTPEGHNPLVRELEAFAAAVRGEPSEIPGPDDGARAVRLAGRILASIEERRRIWSEGAVGARWGDAPSSS
jgi:predicted dehydrogenase